MCCHLPLTPPGPNGRGLGGLIGMPFGAAQRVWETGVLVGVAAESHAAGGLVPDHARKATDDDDPSRHCGTQGSDRLRSRRRVTMTLHQSEEELSKKDPLAPN